MSHTMNIWERIIDRRLREETTIGDEQFGFMPGTVEGRRMQYLRCGNLWRNIGGKKLLHMVFIKKMHMTECPVEKSGDA